mgnify:CR=1 FL=1
MEEQLKGSMMGSVDIIGSLSGAPAVSNYEKLNKKPKINGVELVGNRTFEELGLDKVFASQVDLKEQKKDLQELQNKIDELVDGNEVAY